MKRTQFHDDGRSFYETTGIESEAGEILRRDLSPKEYRRFVKIVQQLERELKHSTSELIDKLLLAHFLNSVEGKPKESFQKNVVRACYRQHREHLSTALAFPC